MRGFMFDAAWIVACWIGGTVLGFGILMAAEHYLHKPAAEERKELREARLEAERAKKAAEDATKEKLLLEAELVVARDAARRAGTRVNPVGGVEVGEADRIPAPAVPFPTR